MPLDIYFEIYQWHLILSILTAFFICFFYMCDFSSAIENAADKNFLFINLSRKKEMSLLVIFIFINIFFCYKGFKFFVAEKANGLGIDAAARYSAQSSERYFDIAIKNDNDNIAYLYNKSCIIFVTELIKNNSFENNTRIKESIELLEKCRSKYDLQPLFKEITFLLNHKYYGEDKKNTLEINKLDYDKINLVKESILERPNNTFSEFSNLFQKRAYENFINKNTEIINDVNKIITEEKVLKPGTKLDKYFNYLSMTFKAALNIEISWAEEILRHGIGSALKASEAASKYLPVKSFRENSLQFIQQLEITSSIACVMPMVWKYSQNLTNEQYIEKFDYFFGKNNLLSAIAGYFIFNNDSEAERFKNFDPALFDYLTALKHFSSGDFNKVIESKDKLFMHKSFKQQIAPLFSWTYYKLGNISEARDFVFFSHINTVEIFKRDFTYKRDLLYSGNILPIYYLPLQSYYNELLGFALIKLNKGDHKTILKEAFGYLNTVVYNN